MPRSAKPVSRSFLPVLSVGIIVLGLSAASACLAADPPPVDAGEPNLLIILDSSASMPRNDRESLRILATQIVFALAGPRENIAIVVFSSQAHVLVPLQSVRDPRSRRNIRADVEEVRAGGFTNYAAALKSAAELLAANPDAPNIVIFISDGKNNRGGSRIDILDLLQQGSFTTLHTVAFKDSADAGLLRDMAVATGGTFSLARTPLQLLQRVQAVARDFWPYVWIEGRSSATIFPGAQKIAFIAERDDKGSAIVEVTLNDKPLPPDLVAKAYAYPSPDSRRGWPIEIWTLDDPPFGRYAARLSPGARILAVLERLPFTVDFLQDKPKSLYREGRDDVIEIAVRLAAPNPDLLAALHQSTTASVLLTDSSPTPLQPQPVTRDPAGTASFLFTAVQRTLEFPSASRDKTIDVLVNLKLRDPGAPSDPATIWTKELRKTVVLRRLQKGIITIKTPDVKQHPIKVKPSLLDFGTLTPPGLPPALMLEVANTTAEAIDLAFESAAPAVGDVPDALAIRVTRPALADEEIRSLSVPPRKTLLISVELSLPDDLPDGDYDAALLLSWTAPDKTDMILEVPTRLSVRRPL